MHFNRVHHISVICSDYKRSKKFYTEVLGLGIISEIFRAERNSYKLDLSLNGVYCLELFSFPNPPLRVTHPEAAGLRHIAFEVDDLSLAIHELAQNNVITESIRTDEVTGRQFTFFRDPDDLPIELYQK